MTKATTKAMRIAAAKEREAAVRREQQEQQEQPEPGSVIMFFRERQSKPRWWERTRENHFMRAYHSARYELRSTPTTSFIAIIQATSSGPVEFLYDWKDVAHVSMLPRIDFPTKEEETDEDGQ